MEELGINPSDYEKIADMTTDKGKKEIMSYIPLSKDDILRIYSMAKD